MHMQTLTSIWVGLLASSRALTHCWHENSLEKMACASHLLKWVPASLHWCATLQRWALFLLLCLRVCLKLKYCLQVFCKYDHTCLEFPARAGERVNEIHLFTPALIDPGPSGRLIWLMHLTPVLSSNLTGLRRGCASLIVSSSLLCREREFIRIRTSAPLHQRWSIFQEQLPGL